MSGLTGEQFGQRRPPLSVTIKAILERYPDGQIFKEIIQNADDAGAETVKFYLDSRHHGRTSLVHPDLAPYQGPALLAYNDAQFTDEDWEGIQNLQRSVKAEDPFKVGKFGIGFNSVYHITDLPMIISGEKLAYMEPQEKVWPERSGRSYNIWKAYTQMKFDSLKPFEGVAGFSAQAGIYPRTLFRFPLRNARSNLSENLYTIQKMRDLLAALKEEAKYLLLFLRSVQEIEVYEISQYGKHMLSFQVVIQERDVIGHKRKNFMEKLKRASAQARPPPYGITRSIDLVTDFHVEVTDHSCDTTTVSHWLVANQVGSQNQTVLDTAAKQHVFPWVGTVLELNSGSSPPTSPGGRIFCFLPMPTEASSSLPVHINGTFSLNDDRRTLKWPGTERKNDTAADWNKMLVSELLPPCYARLLMEAKKHLRPKQFYEAWPEVDEMKTTPWKGLLLPLFTLLFKETVIWTSREGTFGGQWIVLTHGTFIPQGDTLSSLVHRVLSDCDIKLVKVPDRVWEALKYTDFLLQLTLLSPSIARTALRSHPSSYQDADALSKFDLLRYCLSDENHSDLHGLTLLPLADGRFIDFKVPYWSLRTVKERYTCSDKYPRDLLPNIENLLVDLPENPELQTSLQRVAFSQITQLRNLSVQLVAQLLPECFPAWQKKNCVSLTSSSSKAEWLERFWRWVWPHSLKHFIGKMVLPLTSESDEPGFQVTRLNENSSVVYISEECPNELLSALTKLQVRYTQSDEFPYLHHRNLFSYLNRYNAVGVFTAITNACHHVTQLQNVKLTPTEACSLQLFLSTGSKRMTSAHKSVLHNLPIFTVLNQSKLYSIAEAKHTSWQGRAILEPDSFDINPKHLPPSLIVFSRSQNQRPLLDGVDTPSWIDFVLNSLFPLIRGGEYPHTMLDSLMEEVLQLSAMLKSQFPFSESELTHQITNLAFLRISPYSCIRKPPNQLFDPSNEDLNELFKGEDVFPIHPFNKHLQHLRKHGLRQTVTGQEIVTIIDSISTRAATCPQEVNPINISRAKSVLKYLYANPHVLTEKVIFSSRQFSPLKQALQSLALQRSWLPVHSAPPRNYPKHLVWKGRSYTSHLTSLKAPVLLCSDDDAKVLPLVVGSQMFLIQCSSFEICSLLNSTSGVPLSYAVAHLQNVIRHCDELHADTIVDIVLQIYKYLHAHFSDLEALQLDADLHTLSWIWIEQQHTFVSPETVALEPNSTFHQDLEPYLYVLPYGLRKFSKLFIYFGVEKSFSPSQIISVLKMIKAKKATDHHAKSIVMTILNWLTDNGKKPADIPPENLYVPIETQSGKLELMDASSVVYSDNHFLQNYLISDSESEEKYIFVNHCIHSEMAHNLGLTPLRKYMNLSEDTFEDTGQYEPLTVRLKNILKDYKDGLTIVKELLQNADDAEATEVNICYDARQHTVEPKSLFFPGMQECHGPALVVHNNAAFTENDFKNITKLAGATKMDQPLKIGKFGVGFCSVYHITDIPSFVSCKYLHIFDPTLKYLGKAVMDSTRPGQKLRFTDKIVASSKQLIPYAGLYGFDPKTQYDGTIFRFPFRTAPSDISHIVYNEGHINQLVTDLQKSGSKLLLFLRNVQQITFSRIDAGDRKPKLLMKVKKKHVSKVSSRTSECLAHICHIGTTSLPEQYWLVSSHTCEIQYDTCEKYATASVACLLGNKITSKSSKKQTTSYLPSPVKGEVFCFLPLTLQTGLPVHVSSNFAVLTDRRGIRSSDDESHITEEVKWNTDLMEKIIPKAYHSVLEALQCMCVKGSVHQEDYDFFCLWPLRDSLKSHNPWDTIIHPLFELISASELFFSKCTAQWMTLLESKFLSPQILCHSSTSPHSTLQCVISVVETLHLPVVNLPGRYQEHLSPDIQSCTIDEKSFLDIFFKNIASLRQIRNKVLRCLLLAFAVDSTNRKKYLQEYLERNESIPCTPKGTELKRCSELIDPNAYFANMYDPEEGMFPIKDFHKNKLINTALLQLEMISKSLPWSMLTERARTIHKLYTKDRYKALEKARLLIKCIKNRISQSTDYALEFEALSVAVEAPELVTIKFLPVMQKPRDYPLTWYCDLFDEQVSLLSPDELLCGERQVILAGSTAPIVCEAKPREGGCGPIPHSVVSFLGIQTSARTETVVRQLCQLIAAFNSQCELCTSWTEKACSEIYTFLEMQLSVSHNHEEDLSDLQDTNSVWTGKEFVMPEAVATTWSHNGPYLFRLPDILLHKTNLVSALNIKESFSQNDFLRALQEMHDDFGCEPVSKKCQKLIPTLVNELTNIKDLQKSITCYLPDTSFAMCEASKLAYNDAKWCEVDEDYTFVNDIVPHESAVKLGVKLVRSKLLERYESSISHFPGVEFGQRELLTQRIKNILREYPFDITILKELLQNADDSKAMRMYVILDKRKHGTKKLPSSNWKDLQGPSILVWNDSVFSESDLKGIQELGLGSKRSDAETIGQYGIGFNVVYHLTDCPSFLTNGSTLCVFDPHCRYVPGADVLRPGRRYDKLDEKFWSDLADLKSAYLRKGVSGCPDEIKGGSLFRFPLRFTTDLMEQSELVDRENQHSFTLPLSPWRMEQYLKQWAPDMKEALIFLNHVTDLKFYVIESEENPKMQLTHHFEVKIDQAAVNDRTQLHKRASAFTRDSEPCVITYALELIDTVPKETNKWLIQQGVGDIGCGNQTWMFVSKVKPKHGIAIPLIPSRFRKAYNEYSGISSGSGGSGSSSSFSGHSTDFSETYSGFRGKVFCFLPLPLNSNLPVHVNGNFILDASRRDLWHPTIKDEPDDRTRWNLELMEAIASSFADFLVKCQNSFIMPTIYNSRSKMWGDIQKYYWVFPRWLGRGFVRPERELLKVAKMVYQKLATQNARILATIKKLPVAVAATKHHSSSSKLKFQIEWHPLVNEEEPSKQAYFWHPEEHKKSLAPVLESIGMQLCAAPMNLQHHFSDEETELFVASQKSVYEYYKTFHIQITSTGYFPCHISETAFQSVANFKKFTDYLLCTSNDEAMYEEFPEPPFNLPLLLTADGQLRIFTETEKVIRSDFTQLFPESADKFLHPELLGIKYVPTYFRQQSSENWILVSSILSAVLPNALRAQRVQEAHKHIQIASLLKPLWECLTTDAIFSHHLEAIVREWALLPTTGHELFSFRSNNQLLPVVPVVPTSSAIPTLHQHIFQVIQQIGMPILDDSVIDPYQCGSFCPKLSERAKDCSAVKDYCPQLSDHKRILTNLYHLHQQNDISSAITINYAEILIAYLQNINFQVCPEEYRTSVKALPLFLSIEGSLTSVIGKTVYIWPRYACKVGYSKWVSGRNVVFLDKRGAWAKLGPSNLGIKDIPEEDLYIKYIFPAFTQLSETERFQHLQHIRDNLFQSNKLILDSGFVIDNLRRSLATQFIGELKSLPCIGKEGSQLMRVSEFSTHDKEIFRAFSEHFHFLPECFTSNKSEYPKWMEFFRAIGLRETITKQEFQQFCQETASGKTADPRKACSVLVKYLFSKEARDDAWYKDSKFLSGVSRIPFVCTDGVQKLSWIHPVYPAPNTIKTTREEVHMTELQGAALSEHRNIVWTAKCVVDLPYQYWQTDLYEKLQVVTQPSTTDVIQNISAIAGSRFADFSLFDKYPDECRPPKDAEGLIQVMIWHFEFLSEKVKDLTNYELSLLKDLSCIPVYATPKLNITSKACVVLTKPSHVLSTGDTDKYFPFLHRIPDELFAVHPVLQKIGVKSSPGLDHMRVTLETAFNCSDHGQLTLDVNTKRVVQYVIKTLFVLLKEQRVTKKSNVAAVEAALDPLHLPSEEGTLVQTSSLLYCDWYNYRGCKLKLSGTGLSLLNLLTDQWDRGIEDEFCRYLPEGVRPKGLSQCCKQVVSKHCIDSEVENSSAAKSLQTTFSLPNFSREILKVIKHITGNEQLCKDLDPIITQFFQTIRTVTVQNLQTDILLQTREPNPLIGSVKVGFFLQKEETAWYFYLDSRNSVHGYGVMDLVACQSLAEHLIAVIKSQNTDISHSILLELKDIFTTLLKAQTAQELHYVLGSKGIKVESEDIRFETDVTPKIGGPIPQSWHHRLDQDINNLFHPQEWVGYEDGEGYFVFAQVIHPVMKDDGASSDDVGTRIRMRYKIYASEDDEEGKEVSALDLYKFLRGTKAGVREEKSKVLVPYEGETDGNQPKHKEEVDLKSIKKQLCNELREIWKLRQSEKTKAIRRLYLKWHPDKNPDRPELAEEVFKFLQNQIERLEQGQSLEDPDKEPSREDHFPRAQRGFHSQWSSYFRTWNHTAHQHSRYRESEDHFRAQGGGSGGGGGWGHGGYGESGRGYGGGHGGYGGGGGVGGDFTHAQFPFDEEIGPQPDIEEGRRWVEQAEVDFGTLLILLDRTPTSNKVSASVCFMAHEVAEKALKGGMYAKCGLGEKSLESHDLTPLAYALQAEEPFSTQGLAGCTTPLEDYYLDTRFPNRYPDGTTIPSDHYSPQDAQQAKENAENILDMMKALLNS